MIYIFTIPHRTLKEIYSPRIIFLIFYSLLEAIRELFEKRKNTYLQSNPLTDDIPLDDQHELCLSRYLGIERQLRKREILAYRRCAVDLDGMSWHYLLTDEESISDDTIAVKRSLQSDGIVSRQRAHQYETLAAAREIHIPVEFLELGETLLLIFCERRQSYKHQQEQKSFEFHGIHEK